MILLSLSEIVPSLLYNLFYDDFQRTFLFYGFFNFKSLFLKSVFYRKNIYNSPTK